MAFYIWLLVGIVLLGLELMVPGVVLAFFGCGALLVALLVLFLPLSLSVQILILLFSSLLFLILFRKRILEKITQKEKKVEFDSVVGEKVQVIKTIPPGLTGQVELHGARWSAEAHRDDLEIPEGSWVIIRGRKNITLIVEPIK